MNDMIVYFLMYLVLLSISMLFVSKSRLVPIRKAMFYFINGAIAIAMLLSLYYPQFALIYAIVGVLFFGMDLFLFLKYRRKAYLASQRQRQRQIVFSGICGFIYSTCLFANIMIGISSLVSNLVG